MVDISCCFLPSGWICCKLMHRIHSSCQIHFDLFMHELWWCLLHLHWIFVYNFLNNLITDPLMPLFPSLSACFSFGRQCCENMSTQIHYTLKIMKIRRYSMHVLFWIHKILCIYSMNAAVLLWVIAVWWSAIGIEASEGDWSARGQNSKLMRDEVKTLYETNIRYICLWMIELEPENLINYIDCANHRIMHFFPLQQL